MATYLSLSLRAHSLFIQLRLSQDLITVETIVWLFTRAKRKMIYGRWDYRETNHSEFMRVPGWYPVVLLSEILFWYFPFITSLFLNRLLLFYAEGVDNEVLAALSTPSSE